MSKAKQEKSFFEKLATFIVDKRNLFFFLYIAATVFSIFSSGWVQVCNDLTNYLPEDTETRKGLVIMQDELVTYATARIMVSNVSYEIGEALADEMAEIEGVSAVAFDKSEDHFQKSSALFDVTFEGETEDQISKDAMNEIKELLSPYDSYISSEVGYSLVDTLGMEMAIILAVGVVIIIAVLIFTSRSYAEVPVLLITFALAAVLNMGSNYMLGEISFVSNSVAVVLQLALAIDYAIILLHRFVEEREHKEAREACISALSHAIPAISASSLTTVSGLLAMTFMQFRIGMDLGIVLIKAILLSLLSVFTLMPGLLMVFDRAIQKTRHKTFLPQIDGWGKFVIKTRYIGVPVFFALMIGAMILAQKCPYVYDYAGVETARKSESQIVNEKIRENFGSQNVMALLVPKGDYESEKKILEELEGYEEVNYALGLANVEAMDGYTLTDGLTPRQFSEMIDMDYELVQFLYAAYAVENENYGSVVNGLDTYTVPLMDMFLFLYDQVQEGYVTLDEELEGDLEELHEQLTSARAQMIGENYSRMVINLDLPEEGEETFAFLQTIHRVAEKYYDAEDVILAGNSTNDYDLSVSFKTDNIMVNILSIVFVIIVLLFTFQSVGLPILLIMVIQGSIWMNFSAPTISGTPIFFMSNLIVTAIQMGANIDYAIVISNWYSELKQTMPKKEAMIRTLNLSFPTVITSGSILASSSFLICQITTEPSIAGMGECICRGTLISMVVVMLVLPQILYLGDVIVEKTRFNIKVPEIITKPESAAGTVFVNGRVRGRVSGVVDANMYGVIHGEVSAMMEVGASEKKEAEAKEDESIEAEENPE